MCYHDALNFVVKLFLCCTFVVVYSRAEENVIEVIPSLGRSSPELGKIGNQYRASANLKRDNVKPLSDIPSFRLAGVKDDVESVFVKTQSKYRLLKNNSTETIWRGTLQNDDGRIGFATVISVQDSWAGTFVTDKASYQLRQKLGGGFEVRWTLWKDFLPEDEDDVEEEEYFRKLNTNSTIAAGRQIATFIPRDHSSSWIMADGSLEPKSSVVDKQLRHGGRRSAGTTTMDVLIAVTNQAMCEYANLKEGCEFSFANAFPIRQRLTVVEAETNEAFQNSGLNVQIRVVGTLFLEPGTYSYQPTSDDLRKFSGSNLAQQWQEDTGADLVSLITGGGGVCGRAFVRGTFSLVVHACFGQFSFTHELGHSIGCRHNRENCGTDHPYAHGYQDEVGGFRTLMAYSCTGGCPRVLHFSSDAIKYKGRPTGDSGHDCARLIEENAPVVARRNSPPDDFAGPITTPSTPTSPSQPSPTSPSPPTPTSPSPPIPSPTRAPTTKSPVPPTPQPTRPKFTQPPRPNIPGVVLPPTSTNTRPPVNFGSISRPPRASITLPPSSPVDSPVEEEKLTCPTAGTHECPVGENPMHVTRMFFFCFNRCVPEARLRRSEFFGHECGSCNS